MSDTALLDWLNEQVVDAIYLDDGRLIDVRGGNVRKALKVARYESEFTPEQASTPHNDAANRPAGSNDGKPSARQLAADSSPAWADAPEDPGVAADEADDIYRGRRRGGL